LSKAGLEEITAALFVALRQAQGDKACGKEISVLLKDVNYIKDFNLCNECQPEPGEGGFRRTKVGLEEITAAPFVALRPFDSSGQAKLRVTKRAAMRFQFFLKDVN